MIWNIDSNLSNFNKQISKYAKITSYSLSMSESGLKPWGCSYDGFTNLFLGLTNSSTLSLSEDSNLLSKNK